MGVIRILVQGSFSPNEDVNFSAMNSGHADAVAQAIEWLSSTILPKAIAQDHLLATQGSKPTIGFGKRN